MPELDKNFHYIAIIFTLFFSLCKKITELQFIMKENAKNK